MTLITIIPKIGNDAIFIDIIVLVILTIPNLKSIEHQFLKWNISNRIQHCSFLSANIDSSFLYNSLGVQT